MTAMPSPVAPAAAAPRTVAVASGKGGVGKTWFAITLAHALARAGRRVLLVDGDLGLANVDIQLGLMPARDIGAVVAGTHGVAEVAVRHPAGFDILPGSSGSGALAGLGDERLARLLAAVRGAGHDTVVLDLGAGLDRHARRMAQGADLLLVLATEEPTSLTDAYAVLKLHHADHAAEAPVSEARIVVNQASTAAAGERTYATLARACAAFLGHTPKLAGIVRRDERVRDAIRRQTPSLQRHPTAPASADIERLAAGI